MWELDHKEGWVLKNGCFELWCWRRPLNVPWTAKRSNQSILKEIDPEYSLEGLILKLKFQCFGQLMQRAYSLEKKKYILLIMQLNLQFSSVQLLSHIWLFASPWSAVHQASLSITNSQSLLKLMSNELVLPSNHRIHWRPLNLSQHQDLFKWVSYSHQVAKVLEFQLQNQSFQWIFKIDFH